MASKETIQRTIKDLIDWFATPLLICGEPLAGVVVFAKRPGSKIRMALAYDQFNYDRFITGQPLPGSAQPRGWQKSVCVGKTDDIITALQLIFPDIYNSGV